MANTKVATFHIKTFGCQMNVYDSNRIANHLTLNKMEMVNDEKQADIIILNTCYIREKASEKVFSELGRIEKFSRKKERGPIIAVVGCVAKAEGKNIFRRAPYVSIVLSSQKYHLLPELIEQAKSMKKSRLLNTELSGLEKFSSLPKLSSSDKIAFLQIQEGCDKFCTYCVVPNTRGREISRPVADVLSEASNLNDLGVIELNLVGQNVNAYNGVDEGGTPSTLAKLLIEIAKLPNIERIRYTTSYPSESTDELIELHKIESKLMPLLYLPIQSGSNKILKAMNRKYTLESYKELITKFKNANEAIQISSDFIVGFPNETEEDFDATLEIVKFAKFIQSYCFKYSPRPNTAAAKMDNQIPLRTKQERLKRLQDVLRENQEQFNKSCIGKTMKVLFTSKGKLKGEIVGKNEYLQPVIVAGDEGLIGTIQNVKIIEASYANLRGNVVQKL